MKPERQRTHFGWFAVLLLTVGGSITSTAWSWGTTDMQWWARPYFWIPPVFAAIPFIWPWRGGLATGLLALYLFLPWSLSIGILFLPATLAALAVGLVERRERRQMNGVPP